MTIDKCQAGELFTKMINHSQINFYVKQDRTPSIQCVYTYVEIQYIKITIYLSIYLSIYVSIYLSIYLSIYPSIYLSIYVDAHGFAAQGKANSL